MVIAFIFYVWVDDSDQLPVMSVELLLHAQWVREGVGIPGEVLLAIGVLNVEPDYVVRDSMSIHLLVNVLDVLVGNVVPSTLVISDRELLRKLGVSSKLAILRYDVL